MPLISVVCLSYNHQRYVKTAIASLLRQTIGDFELVIVDDGSTDQSVDLIQSFQDSRIRLITQENRGPGYASSRAISECRGDFIALMSADDVAMPQRLERQLTLLANPALGIVFSRPALIDEAGAPLPDARWPIFFKRGFSTQEEAYRTLFFRGNFLCATSAMLRRSLPINLGWVHNGLLQLQDFELWARLAPHTGFHLSEERLLQYRVRDKAGNLSSGQHKWRDSFERPMIYRHFFDGAPASFVLRAFPEIDAAAAGQSDVHYRCALAKLLLEHKHASVRRIGAEQLLELSRDVSGYDDVAAATGLSIFDLYNALRQNDQKMTEAAADGPVLSRWLRRLKH